MHLLSFASLFVHKQHFEAWKLYTGYELIQDVKLFQQKNTAKLYGDALVWSAVFIDWFDWFELVS